MTQRHFHPPNEQMPATDQIQLDLPCLSFNEQESRLAPWALLWTACIIFLSPVSVTVPAQVVDDILDITKSTEELGKTAGKDIAQDKATYPK